MTEPTQSAPRATGIYVAAVAFLSLVYFAAVLSVTGGTPAKALRATVLAVGPAILLAALVQRLGRRLRWFEGQRPRLALLHGALALGYSAAWAGGTMVIFALEQSLTIPGARFRLRPDFLGFSMFTGVLLYASVAAVAFGLETSGRLRDERARAARAETLRVQAELSALRAQLNPHFLFNTLHTVLGLVRRDPALAEEALQDLGDVLRYALGGRDDVELREEMEVVGRYLAIERIRLGDRLRVEEDLAPAALACRLPAFSVQPLVENAVRYAVASRAQGGRVRIEARCRDGRLAVVVSDDGAGAPPASAGAGLGLGLVRQRLEAAFGAAARLTAEKTEAGFVVTLDVPGPEEPA